MQISYGNVTRVSSIFSEMLGWLRSSKLICMHAHHAAFLVLIGLNAVKATSLPFQIMHFTVNQEIKNLEPICQPTAT
jgi:hypothetical protein